MKISSINNQNFKGITKINCDYKTARAIEDSINCRNMRLRYTICDGEFGDVYALRTDKDGLGPCYIVSGEEARKTEELFSKIIKETNKTTLHQENEDIFETAINFCWEKYNNFVEKMVKNTPLAKEINATLVNGTIKIYENK